VAPHAFHDRPAHPDPVHVAVADVIGEGIATDLLGWLRKVADPETALFVDTVLADEAGRRTRLVAFLELGRPHQLVGTIVAGYARRTAQLGIGPLGRLHDMSGALAQITRRDSAA